MPKKTKPCADCGKLIKAIRQTKRCKECRKSRNQWLKQKYMSTRLGSPALFKKLQSGRIVPADFGCGYNKHGTFPQIKKPWMNFFFDDNSNPIDQDLLERDRVIEEGQDEQDEGDWMRVMMYNWKNGIDEHEQPPSRYEIFRKWKYWEQNI